MVIQDIKSLSLEDLKSFLRGQGQKPFHAHQIFSWIYKQGVGSFDSMSDLSFQLRKILQERFYFSKLLAKEIKESIDGTKKFLFKLEDGSLIESVLIPTEKRNTLCISTQVGCKFSCKFCASGIKGFKRNLSTGEIVTQALFIKKHCLDKQISHFVFMGTGEPFDNYENVLGAIRIFNSNYGLNIAARRITISTSGLIPGIKKLIQENLQVELSVSLHASDNKTRNLLMPINKKYPLEELIKACREYFSFTRRQVTFEYVLIHNLNCSLDDAKKLSLLLKRFDTFDGAKPHLSIWGSKAPLSINPEHTPTFNSKYVEWVDFKLNLIPYNKVEEFNFEPPTKLEVLFFQNQLTKLGIKSTLRMPRGRDINASCGQLRLRYEK